MSNNNLAGFPAYGPRVDVVPVFNPRIVTHDPAIELPTSEPATAQVQFTLATTDLPTFSPACELWGGSVADRIRYRVHIYAYVQNVSGGAATIYAKYKTANTPTWSSAISASATNNWYYSIGGTGLTSWSIGDVQEIKLYASAAGVKLLKSALIIYPTSIGKGLTDKLSDLYLTFSLTSLIGGNSLRYTTAADYIMYNSIVGYKALTAGSQTSGCWQTDSTYGMIFVSGESTSSWLGSATGNFTHAGFYYPTRIAYTPLL